MLVFVLRDLLVILRICQYNLQNKMNSVKKYTATLQYFYFKAKKITTFSRVLLESHNCSSFGIRVYKKQSMQNFLIYKGLCMI